MNIKKLNESIKRAFNENDTDFGALEEYLKNLSGTNFCSENMDGTSEVDGDEVVYVSYLVPFEHPITDGFSLDDFLDYCKYRRSLVKRAKKENGVCVSDAPVLDKSLSELKDEYEDMKSGEDQDNYVSSLFVTIDYDKFDGNLEYIKQKIEEYAAKLKRNYDIIKDSIGNKAYNSLSIEEKNDYIDGYLKKQGKHTYYYDYIESADLYNDEGQYIFKFPFLPKKLEDKLNAEDALAFVEETVEILKNEKSDENGIDFESSYICEKDNTLAPLKRVIRKGEYGHADVYNPSFYILIDLNKFDGNLGYLKERLNRFSIKVKNAYRKYTD